MERKSTRRPCAWTPPREENITLQTDAKLSGKVMERLRSIAQDIGIKLTQSYRFIGKKLLRATHNEVPSQTD